ncbi:dynein regulatory complex protein 1 [Selaginella moellendorffii]|nr:dynein regulatory complex protein 1 [Selaginella moellendorffii]|eukprot:XP_002981481.2 dynein regulatory complex protein 1 [Selaginella moellendorffii]
MTLPAMNSVAALAAEQKAAQANREARISARRQRIANRLLALQSSQATQRPKTHTDEKEAGPALMQLSSSLQNLSFLKKNLANDLNHIRGSVDDEQCNHQECDRQRLQELRQAQEEVEMSCEQQNQVLAARWDAIRALEVPQQIAEQLENQRKACNQVLETKDKLAEKIKEVLLLKTEEYNLACIQQTKDVDMLVLAMGKQVVNLTAAYIKEFHEIESAFLVQRWELIQSKKAEIEGLIKKMRAMEAQFQESLYARGDEYSAALDETRLQDSEDYNLLKVKLETDVQILEQHLESMQAAYQMNTEKLDYNYRVLIERENDNYVTAGQQKRKLTKLRDIQTNLKTKHAELERKFKWQNAKLADDYARVTKLLQDLQSKEQELTAGHEYQFLKFYAMHQHCLAVLVSKVLQADQYIHEQHLGWKWHPPDPQLFIDLASPGPVEAESDSANMPSTPEAGLAESITLAVDKPMLDMLCSELAFILDEEAQKLDAGLEMDDQSFVRSIAILQALGISSGITLDKLRKFVTTAAGRMIQKETVIPRLQEFLIENKAEDLVPKLQVGGRRTPVERPKEKEIKATEEEEKWRKFAKVISPKVVHVWPALDIAMLKYNHVLKDRVVVAREIQSLRWQNEELKRMLKLCLSSKAHEELHVPTTMVAGR